MKITKKNQTCHWSFFNLSLVCGQENRVLTQKFVKFPQSNPFTGTNFFKKFLTNRFLVLVQACCKVTYVDTNFSSSEISVVLPSKSNNYTSYYVLKVLGNFPQTMPIKNFLVQLFFHVASPLKNKKFKILDTNQTAQKIVYWFYFILIVVPCSLCWNTQQIWNISCRNT